MCCLEFKVVGRAVNVDSRELGVVNWQLHRASSSFYESVSLYCMRDPKKEMRTSEQRLDKCQECVKIGSISSKY